VSGIVRGADDIAGGKGNEMSSVETFSSRTSARITEAEEYDLVMLGSGTGSKFLAWTFAQQGQRVATIERKYLGGSCPNIACLPSKKIIHSAKVASYFRRGSEFGITTDGFAVNMSAVQDRKRRMVSADVDFHRNKY
jgi:pyruvate/2-oxoglutarate dehydrogenase complex dihydrolipoamide dehydrogenase (E3) component